MVMFLVPLLVFSKLTEALQFDVKKAVVEEIRNGRSFWAVSRMVGVHQSTVRRWWVLYSAKGVNALHRRKRTGRPPKLKNRHWQWMLNTVVTKTPQQLRFEFALWTANMVRMALQEKFGLQVSRWTVQRAMKKLNLTPQKPKKRALKHDREKVRKWQFETFPALVKRAVQEGKTIVFADESGLAAQCVYGRTWGRKGETPIVKTANSKYRVSMLAAISPDGRLHWKLHEGSVSALTFIEFLEQVKQATAGTVIVVVDNASVHTAKLVREWSKAQEGQIELEYQPTYSPEVNPVEILWAWVKSRVSRMLSKTKAEMRKNLKAALERLSEDSELVKKFFSEQDCKYIEQALKAA